MYSMTQNQRKCVHLVDYFDFFIPQLDNLNIAEGNQGNRDSKSK